MTTNRTRHLAVLFLTTSLAAVQLPSHARAGSPAPAPRAAPAKAPAAAPKAAPAPKAAVATSSRAGSGSSVGAQRPDVMDRVRAAEPRRAPSPSPSTAAAIPAVATPPAPGGYSSSGFSGASSNAATRSRDDYERRRRNDMLKAATAGAVVGGVTGYAVGHRSTSPASATGNPSGHGDQPGGVSDGPAVHVAQDEGVSGARVFGWMLFLGLVGGNLVIMYRRWAASRTASSPSGYGTLPRGSSSQRATPESNESQLHSLAPSLFNDIQSLNNAGDLEALASRTTEEMFSVFERDINQRTVPSQTRVADLSARVVDLSREGSGQRASVAYKAMISEGPDDEAQHVHEVWHFVREEGPGWKLAGIEQV